MKNLNSFLFVLNGVIIGMALVKIISGFASFIEKKDKYKFYWVHTLLTLMVFILLAQYWFILRDFSEVYKSFWTYISSLLYPLALYFISALLLPDTIIKNDSNNHIDISAYYDSSSSYIYFTAWIGVIIAYLYNVIFSEKTFISKSQILRLIVIISLSIMVHTKKKIIHKIGVVLLFIFLCVFLLIEHNPLF